MKADNIIEASGLTKRYGDVHAIQGVDFEVQPGEIFALLGPNGAGKSSTVEILEGLRPRDGGEVRVLGIDPATDSSRLKSKIGVALQSTSFSGKIRVIELIELYAHLYRAKPDTKKLLDRFDLGEKAKAFYETLSGGQKQKVALILAMINDPPLVFLDEPTSALDAHTRRAIHDWLRELRAQGRTVFLTTHYIHEAEQLADRVAIMARGKIVRIGPIGDIAKGLNLESEVRVRTEKPVGKSGAAYSFKSADPAATITELVRQLDAGGNRLLDIEVLRPTLEDAFLMLTGERLTEAS